MRMEKRAYNNLGRYAEAVPDVSQRSFRRCATALPDVRVLLLLVESLAAAPAALLPDALEGDKLLLLLLVDDFKRLVAVVVVVLVAAMLLLPCCKVRARRCVVKTRRCRTVVTKGWFAALTRASLEQY